MEKNLVVTLSQQIEAVQDEIGQKKRYYPFMIKKGTIDAKEALSKLACLQATLKTLESVRESKGNEIGMTHDVYRLKHETVKL